MHGGEEVPVIDGSAEKVIFLADLISKLDPGRESIGRHRDQETYETQQRPPIEPLAHPRDRFPIANSHQSPMS